MKILITGASKGIGFYLFEKFKTEGFRVFGTYSSTLPLEKYEQDFEKVDVANDKEVKGWVDSLVSNDDEIVLINCASVNYNTIARKADVQKWKYLIDVNLIGTFAAINAVLPFMHEKKYGRIINFSSILAQKGLAGTSAYAASKAALWGMAKAIAVENAKNNITINNINLGYFNIGMTLNDVPESVLSDIKKQIPAQKLGNPEDIYKAVKYLIDSEFTTGTSLDINGGLF